MTRVVVVDDHPLVRQGVTDVVRSEPGFEVVGEAARAEEAFELVTRVEPDVVVLDVAMPGKDGPELAADLLRVQPGLRIIFLTMHDDDLTLRRAVALNADGFVIKSAAAKELGQALQAVAEGGSYFSPSIARRVMNLARDPGRDTSAQLSDRELEILGLLAEGARPKEVAEQLFLSVKTVKNHLTSIYAKLGVESAAQAVATAYRRGLVGPTRQG